jgi:hypothetical protein
MEYIYNLAKYDQLKDSYPNNALLKICIDKYELYLQYYMNTGKYIYKLDMDVISAIIRSYLNENMDTVS